MKPNGTAPHYRQPINAQAQKHVPKLQNLLPCIFFFFPGAGGSGGVVVVFLIGDAKSIVRIFLQSLRKCKIASVS